MLGGGGQGAELGGDDVGEPVGQRQRPGTPAPPGVRVSRDRAGQFDQRHRVTGCLGEHLACGPCRRSGRGCWSSSRPACDDGNGFRCSSGRPRSKPAGGALPRTPRSSTTGSASRRWPTKASASSELRSSQVSVIDHHEHRGRLRQVRQQGKQGDAGHQPVRGDRIPVRGRAPPAARSPGVRGGRESGPATGRSSAMQPGEREIGLRLPAGHRQYAHPRTGPPCWPRPPAARSCPSPPRPVPPARCSCPGQDQPAPPAGPSSASRPTRRRTASAGPRRSCRS